MNEKRETLLRVEGMTCTSCVGRVDDALRELEGIDDVEVSLRDRRVCVRHDAEIHPEAMIEALRDAGYEGAPTG